MQMSKNELERAEKFLDNQQEHLDVLNCYFKLKDYSISEISFMCATILINCWMNAYDEPTVHKMMEDMKRQYQINIRKKDE